MKVEAVSFSRARETGPLLDPFVCYPVPFPQCYTEADSRYRFPSGGWPHRPRALVLRDGVLLAPIAEAAGKQKLRDRHLPHRFWQGRRGGTAGMDGVASFGAVLSNGFQSSEVSGKKKI